MSRFGFQKMSKRIGLPHTVQGNRFLFDTNAATFQTFFTSVDLAYQDSRLRVFYSLRQLANLYGKKSNDTMRTFLKRHDIPIFRIGKKSVVLLVDFYHFQQLIANKQLQLENNDN